MSMQFNSPSYRASGSDLTVSVSPLGLVELADEEFEVHGPRLNRYAAAWAWYLGHHWSYRREQGEPQLSFNYVRAFCDYVTNFCFSHGVSFEVPDQNRGVTPYILQRAWEVDNPKGKILWEMGQVGGVTGDCFVKIAYEEAYADPTGLVRPGRIRILPLNPASCFPEFHPHDRTRLLRFKLKYRFWGTSLEGTRQVYTYTELMTDEMIEEYINDELIDQRPNPLGRIPVVHIANVPVSASPWGLSDIYDIIPLNREFNEKMTEISDIINYHAAPVTIITGAKASQLERGPKKVWAGLPKEAQVFNLEMQSQLQTPMAYVETIKRAMHEMTGVPETALGQVQPISNTSGVALSIQFQPLMNKRAMKMLQYSQGLEQINELIILTAAVFEPQLLVMDVTNTVPESDYLPQLDPRDPVTYRTTVVWQDPLPVDKLIKLNEVQVMLALGLTSKEGALRVLGEHFPNEVLAEIFDEQMEDALAQGALDMLRAQVAQAVMLATGMVPTPDGGAEPVPPAGGTDGGSAGSGGASGGPPAPAPSGPVQDLMNELVQKAYGTKFAQRRVPSPSSN
jgi:Phage portal protein, SPP1 Gp6-like